MGLLNGLIRAARPRQWVKNVLVAAAPGAAGALGEGDVLRDVLLGFVAFCLVASGTYYLNDVRDAEEDREHATKRHRPIAAGVVPVRVALAIGALLFLAGFAVAALVDLDFLLMVAGYVALTSAYTMVLRDIPILDIVGVASGFIVRAVSGGVLADVPLSRWFVIVASFGSLFLVAGKRHGEHLDLGPDAATRRPTLAIYSAGYLHYVWSTASAITLLAYCLWAFEQAEGTGTIWFELSILPFVIFILRYALLLDQGKGSVPEDIVLADRPLQLVALAWVAVFAGAVYLG